MPAVPVNEEDKTSSGFYEPFGQAPIAVAHSLQLPCGNKFLMMVRGGAGWDNNLCRMLQTAQLAKTVGCRSTSRTT